MIFTRHAFERYRQFHMLDQPAATDEDARQVLERFGSAAVQAKAKTFRGDPIWIIEALGVELVAKHEDGVVTCVTVLPPPEFRGLTPLQAERVADAADEVRRRADEALLVAAQLEIKAKTIKSQKKAPTQAARHAANIESAKLHVQISESRTEALRLCAERDILAATLKTMRHQLNRDENEAKMRAVVRAAVRRMIAVGDEDGLAEIAELEPAFMSPRFVDGDR